MNKKINESEVYQERENIIRIKQYCPSTFFKKRERKTLWACALLMLQAKRVEREHVKDAILDYQIPSPNSLAFINYGFLTENLR